MISCAAKSVRLVLVLLIASSSAPVASQGSSASGEAGLTEVPSNNEVRQILDLHVRDAMLEASKEVKAYVRVNDYLNEEHMKAVARICIGLRDVFVYFERHKARYGDESASRIRPLVKQMFGAAEKRLRWIEEDGITGPTGSRACLLGKIYDRIKAEFNDRLLKVES